jgi:hypothetical protein
MAAASAPAPAPFPEGDPRNAKYFENLAALEHSKGKTEAEDKRGREETESQYKYNTEQLQGNERNAVRGNMNTANSQGLLQSGLLAGRQAQTQVQYGQKEHALSESRRQAVERYNRQDQSAREGYERARTGALTKAEIEARNSLLANPPAPPPPPPEPGPYPKAEALVAQKFPGGINEQHQWIKEHSKYSPLRNAASKKAVG